MMPSLSVRLAAFDSTDVIVTHLQECVRKHVDEVMTKTDVLKLMELVRSQDPTLVNGPCADYYIYKRFKKNLCQPYQRKSFD